MKTIKVELKVNCPYGKIGNVVELDESIAKAYGEDMVKTTKDLTPDVDSIIPTITTNVVDEGKAQKDKEEAERIEAEKKENERLEAEKIENERIEKERLEAEQAEAEKELKQKETKEVKNQQTK